MNSYIVFRKRLVSISLSEALRQVLELQAVRLQTTNNGAFRRSRSPLTRRWDARGTMMKL
jgi:hypothetical protein